MLIGSWSRVFGQDTGSCPPYGARPNSVSDTPSPSLPGSHASTIESAESRTFWGRISGRPDTITTTHRLACEQTVSIACWSLSEICMSLTGRGCPLSPGSKAHCGPNTSPKPSEYGVSPTTTTPTSFLPTGSEASSLHVTFWVPASWRIPSRMVVPGITLVEPPCQVSVQP